MYIIKSDYEEHKFLNGYRCKIVNNQRDDKLLDCYVPVFSIFVLLHTEELEDY